MLRPSLIEGMVVWPLLAHRVGGALARVWILVDGYSKSVIARDDAVSRAGLSRWL